MSDSQAEAPDLSIILVTWNSLELIRAALASIQEHTREVSYEVFVVDNGTTRDDTVQVLPCEFPSVHLIANRENLGFTRANNQAIRQARGRYVLLLNSDTIQIENALGTAVHYMGLHPDVGVLGIMHRNADASRSLQQSFYPFPNPWHDVMGLLGLKKGMRWSHFEASLEQDVDWVCGSFFLIRRACLEQVGELDERFFSYDEDIDWCLRARRAGWKVRYWPGASMIHLGSAAAPFLKDKTFVMYRSHLTYLAKNHSRFAAGCYYLAMLNRLLMSSLKQTACCLIGKASFADLCLRWQRQVQFLCLRPGRTGAK